MSSATNTSLIPPVSEMENLLRQEGISGTFRTIAGWETSAGSEETVTKVFARCKRRGHPHYE